MAKTRVIDDDPCEASNAFLALGIVIAAAALLDPVVLGPRVLPPEFAGVWWPALALWGGTFLVVGLLLHLIRRRIEVGDEGLRFLPGRVHFRWADVRSWREESYREQMCDEGGNVGWVDRTRVVVELGSRPSPLVFDHLSGHPAIAAELRARLPGLERPVAPAA
jgi:hypothetical protein